MSVRKVFAINASRKTHNTAMMLKKALEGAESEGAQTQLINLHDFKVNGCKGCMACKMLKNVPPKSCLQKDELSPILEKCVYDADSVLVGGPIYFWQPGGVFRSFSERLLYPYYIYGAPAGKSYYPRKDQKWGIIYTMGASMSEIEDFTCNKKGEDSMDALDLFYKKIIGNVEELKVYMTSIVKDFNGYELDWLNRPEKKDYHDKIWGQNLEKAYQMGKRLAIK